MEILVPQSHREWRDWNAGLEGGMNPHLLPKVRSPALMDACRDLPCTLKLATFIPEPCAPQNTVVGCHLPVFGKGTGTKVSDLYVAAGCSLCHDLLDGRDPRGGKWRSAHPAEWHGQILRALCQTQALMVERGIITVQGEVI